MFLSDYIPSKSSIFLSIVTLIFGLVGGWFTSAYFASEAKQKEIADAVEEARRTAIGEGREQALKDFESTAPDRLIEMFPEVFELARKDAREAGFAQGKQEAVEIRTEQIRREGHDDGYDQGFSEGKIEGEKNGFARAEEQGFNDGYSVGYAAGDRDARNRQIDLEARLAAAEKDWSAYEALVRQLGEAARLLDEEPENQELISRFTSLARAVEKIAEELQTAHIDQASSFNSLMEDLRNALEVRNFPRMRETSRAIQNTLETKRELYLFGKKRALETFSELTQ